MCPTGNEFRDALNETPDNPDIARLNMLWDRKRGRKGSVENSQEYEHGEAQRGQEK